MPDIKASADVNFLDASGRRLPGEIRGGAGTLTIEAGDGNRKRFKMLAYSGGPLALRDYAHPVVVDLAGVNIEAQSMMMLAEHDENRPVGESESIKITAGGIEIAGYLDADTDDGKLIHAAGKGGFAWEGSIGAPVHEMEEYGRGERVTVNGRQFTGPLYVARKTTLKETSFVKRGADVGKTHVSIAATHKGDSKMEPKFEAYITASGFDPATLTEPQTATLKAAFDAAEKKAAKEAAKAAAAASFGILANDSSNLEEFGNKLLAKFQATQAAEQVRIQAINRACINAPDIAAKAIGEGWTADKAELEVLRAGRPDNFNVIIRAGETRESEQQVLQAALILQGGGTLDNPVYQRIEASRAPQMKGWLRASVNADSRQKIMDAAHRFAEISAIDLCRRCIILDGKNIPDGKEQIIRAAFSGASFSNIFTTSMYAQLISGFLQPGDTTESWTQSEDVVDFKVNDEIRLLTLGGVPQKLPRGTEAKHVTRSDEVESYRLNRYAAQFVVDDQDAIDDRFGALLQMAPDMGLWFSSIPQDLVYAVLLANPTLGATSLALFSDSNSPDNLRATSALSDTNLQAAIPQMQLAQENGRNLNLKATHLVIPTALEFAADKLINSAALVGGSSAAGDKNVLRGRLAIVSDARLDNGVTSPDTGVTSSGSGTTWYLVSTSPGVRTIKRIYRTGTGRAPQLRNSILTQGQWGQGWDICFDVGAAAMDFRGLQKNTA